MKTKREIFYDDFVFYIFKSYHFSVNSHDDTEVGNQIKETHIHIHTK